MAASPGETGSASSSQVLFLHLIKNRINGNYGLMGIMGRMSFLLSTHQCQSTDSCLLTNNNFTVNKQTTMQSIICVLGKCHITWTCLFLMQLVIIVRLGLALVSKWTKVKVVTFTHSKNINGSYKETLLSDLNHAHLAAVQLELANTCNGQLCSKSGMHTYTHSKNRKSIPKT